MVWRRLIIWILAAASAGLAQDVRASLGGRVTDVQGALVPAASIAVISDDTAIERRTSTNAQGSWFVEFLLPGHYHFTISAPGFKTAERTRIELQAADNKQIDVMLEVGTALQSVVVTPEPLLIDSTSAVSGTVITSEQIMEMPPLRTWLRC